MVLRQREFTFVTNSKIISWPVCTSLHSCSNPFPQFRKELFVLEYNVIKQRMLDNVPMYMFQNIPKYMSSKMFISNSKFSIFSENSILKVVFSNIFFETENVYFEPKMSRWWSFWAKNSCQNFIEYNSKLYDVNKKSGFHINWKLNMIRNGLRNVK